MKTFILTLLVIVAVNANGGHDDHTHAPGHHAADGHSHGEHGHGHDHGKKIHLPHFKQEQLSADFQKFHIPADAGCSPDVQKCMKRVHKHGGKCVGLWMKALGPQITACHDNNQEVRDSDTAWQEASFEWHHDIQRCLAGEPVPSSGHSRLYRTFFLRKKRSMDEAHDAHDETEVTISDDMTYQQCWGNLRTEKQACKEKILTCSKLAACSGLGPEPTDATELAWYNRIKEKRADVDAKVRDSKTKMHSCLGIEGGSHTFNENPTF